MGFASLYPSYGLRSGGVVRMQRIVAVHRGLGQQVAVHGAEHVAGGEAFGQVEPVYVECEQAEEVAVHAQVVRRRVRAVVAEPVATHVIATGEPAGVVVQPLARAGRAVRRALAALVDAVAATAGGDLAHVGGDVGTRPGGETSEGRTGGRGGGSTGGT